MQMTVAYYSTVLDQPIDAVWSLIRDFNNYPVYIDGVTDSVIEDEKRGDEVGAIRRFCYAGNWIRQSLGDHSDAQHSLSYVGIDPLTFPEGTRAPVRYEGTMHLLPVIEGGRTFIEWSVKLDAAPDDRVAWENLFNLWIPAWTDSLRRTLERQAT
jgi:hypothetical protein